MGDFFKGWKRKAGLVTLAMALLVFAPWMRSARIADEFFLPGEGCIYSLRSGSGQLFWMKNWNTDGSDLSVGITPLRNSYLIRPLPSGFIEAPSTYEWQYAWGGFDFYKRQYSTQCNVGWVIPYWSLVLPLTLLSAWLILVKARNEKRTQASIDSRSQEGQ